VNAVQRVTRTREQARASYDRLSRWYDILSAFGEGRFARLGLSLLNPREGETVLEIGFGTGKNILSCAKAVGAGGRVCGIDLSEGMLRRAQARVDRSGYGSRVSLVRGDALALPFDDGAFDAVFMSFTLELFDTPEIPVVLRGCRRVLREGGRLGVVALALPFRPNLAVRVYAWAHERFPAAVDCRPIPAGEAVKEAGFSQTNITGGSIFGLPVELVIAERACERLSARRS
jgi:ubiquinone/menaquinone biosynthesis C-methylase UbiE